MGSKRVGCPLPTPLDSRALRLGTLTNLFVGDLSFFFFCCIKNNTRENTHLLPTNQQENRKIVGDYKFGSEKFWNLCVKLSCFN